MEILVKTIDDNGELISCKENASISLDTLTLSSKANQNLLRKLFEIQCNGQHYLVNKDVSIVPNLSLREKGYRFVADVYYQKEVYLQLAFNPLIDLIPRDQLKIKISNHVLYERNWVERIDLILKFLNLECLLSELHIALDAPEIADKFLRLYYEPSFQLVKGKPFGKDDKEKKFTAKNGFHFNKRASDLYITFYNKSADYIEKPHIKKFHELNGVHGNIHRIEIRVKKVSVMKAKGLTWRNLGNTETLLQIFKSEFESRIVFNDMSRPTYDRNRNRKYLRINPIDFPSTVSQLIQQSKTTPNIESIKSKKTTIKNLFKQAINNPCDYNVLALKEMIDQNNLWEWFETRRKSWSIFPSESMEVVIAQINRLANENQKESWIKRILPKLVILKLPDWKMESLACESNIMDAA